MIRLKTGERAGGVHACVLAGVRRGRGLIGTVDTQQWQLSNLGYHPSWEGLAFAKSDASVLRTG